LLGQGDGTFGGQQVFAVGSSPRWVAVADLNGDGKADLAVANHSSSSNPVSVLLGNGDGSFGGQQTVAADGLPTTVAVADFNWDALPGPAVACPGNGETTVIVLLGHGDGSFQAPSRFGAGQSPTALAVADLNGDGKADLAVTYAVDNAVRVFQGNGDGTF